MTLTRLPDWEERFAALLAEARDRPHAYGGHDCLLFCAAVVEAITGTDWGSEHRGRYRTEAGSTRYLRRLGFDSAEAMIDSLLPERPVAFARRGDLVLAGGIPGACVGGTALFVGQEEDRAGLVREPRAAWAKAWAVG